MEAKRRRADRMLAALGLIAAAVFTVVAIQRFGPDGSSSEVSGAGAAPAVTSTSTSAAPTTSPPTTVPPPTTPSTTVPATTAPNTSSPLASAETTLPAVELPTVDPPTATGRDATIAVLPWTQVREGELVDVGVTGLTPSSKITAAICRNSTSVATTVLERCSFLVTETGADRQNLDASGSARGNWIVATPPKVGDTTLCAAGCYVVVSDLNALSPPAAPINLVS